MLITLDEKQNEVFQTIKCADSVWKVEEIEGICEGVIRNKKELIEILKNLCSIGLITFYEKTEKCKITDKGLMADIVTSPIVDFGLRDRIKASASWTEEFSDKKKDEFSPVHVAILQSLQWEPMKKSELHIDVRAKTGSSASMVNRALSDLIDKDYVGANQRHKLELTDKGKQKTPSLLNSWIALQSLQ